MSSNNSWNSAYNSAIGDLLVGNGTRPVVRTVGADGTALIADSGQADGVNWGFPSGVITNASQPVFYSNLNVPAVNATGDGTTYQIIFNNINYQVGTGYDNTTGIFTAPVTGHYYIYAAAQLSGMAASHLNGFLQIFPTGTGVGGYLLAGSPFNFKQSFFNNLIWSGSNIVRLAAGDTVVINVQVSGVAAPKTVTVDNAFFNGALLF